MLTTAASRLFPTVPSGSESSKMKSKKSVDKAIDDDSEWWVKYAPTKAGRKSELHSHKLAKEDYANLWLFVKKKTFTWSGTPVWDDQDK